MALGAPPESLAWSNGAWVSGDGSDPDQVQTIDDIALYAHGTGAAAAGRGGRARRAGRLSRLTARVRRARAASRRPTSTSSTTLSAPNRAEYGFIPHVGLLDHGAGLQRARPASARSNASGGVVPRSVSSPSTRSPPSALGHRRRAERDRLPLQHVVVDRLLDAPPCRRRRAPACRRCPRCTRSEPPSAVSSTLHAAVVADRQRRLPARHVDQQVVPRLGRRAGAAGAHRRASRSPGPSRYVPAGIAIARSLYCPRSPEHPATEDDDMAVELDHPFTTSRPIDDSFATILDLEQVVPCVEGGERARGDGAGVGQGPDQGARWARCR